MAHFAIAPMALEVKHHHHHTSHHTSTAQPSISPSPTVLSHTQLVRPRELHHSATREEILPLSSGTPQRKMRKEDSGEGHTSFLRAARAGHLDKIIEQLKNNVDINTSNANGLNALHLASKDGHLHVVSELLNRGANVDSATKKGNTALHIASLAGQHEVVKQLVENGASVNVQSQNGFTPLYMAAQENHDEVVRYLLDHGANQSLSTEDGFTPLAVAMQQGHDKVVAVLLENDTRGKVRLPALHIAAKKDDTKAAKLLLENEHNPDVTSKSGFTPLHIASHYGNEDVANILLDKRADVNFSAKHNITPLHVAAKWGKANMVTVLLSRGANIDNKTRDGLTALHCAARSGHEAVIEQLLENGAPISSKTKNGLAPLHMAAQGDHVDTARVLLFHKAPVDDVTVDYLTALHVAAHCGHARVAKTLLDKKADPNARALNGFTPLHIACKKNRIKVVELLLKHGASIEATTESGLTPLHVASFMGCMNIVIYLLQNEANPDVPTVRGETPLHLAARANQTDIIRILLRNGAQVDARAREQQTPLHIASRLGNVDIVMLLLQHGAVVDSTTKDLYTALHIAAKEGQEEVAAVLLENGASLTSATKKGFTPLHLTGKYGHIKVAKLLLQKDAPVDFQGKNGVTPLHVASHYDHQNVALLLLEKGASVHATAKNGHTPLHIAAKKNQMDIATTLLEYGAKSNAESVAGFTPLHLSASEGHSDMSAMLIEHEADVNHAAKNGLTPLHLCAQEDRVAVSEILLKNGAKVDAPTMKGFTPLHIACHYGQLSMVRLLLDNGANVSCTTDQGFTPLHHSAQQGHSTIVALLLDRGASPNATNKEGHTALSIAQKLGYISVEESLKGVTETLIIAKGDGEKHKVVAPEIMQETFMSDSEDENGEDTLLNDQPYRYLTVDEMKSLGDDSLPIDVTRDERTETQVLSAPPTADHDSISPLHASYTLNLTNVAAPDNVDIGKVPPSFGFLVSFLVDARGGAMRGCRHSGVRLIVPPRRAAAPTRVTCRYLRKDKLPHPPPLMEGEALASRILELGPVGAKFLGPVMIEVPHFASLRGSEREIVILRSDNGEAWREHTVESSEEVVQEILSHSFEKEDMPPPVETDPSRLTRILTLDFPHYFAVVSRVKQEVHAIGPEGGMVSSTVVPQVQAVFPQGALTKKIKVGLQAQPIPTDITAKLLGNRVAVSPIVTIEPRRRKFHKPITLTIPVPQAANKGMINQYSGDAPTLRLLCSITGGTARAQWEDVTGTTPLTFVKDCVSFTTTVSARFWLMDCRNVQDSAKMATELYREAIHVPFLAKFVVFAKRIEELEARVSVFCMTDDKEDKTLEHQEHFTEVAKSRDVEVLEGKSQFVEFTGNLVPVTKSGDQLRLGFRAFRENRLPFTVRVKDPHADVIGRTLFMREPKVSKGEAPQQPICVLNIVLPEDIIPETSVPESELTRYQYLSDSRGLESYHRSELRLPDISNHLENDWIPLASSLGISNSDISKIQADHPDNESQQALAMLRLWMRQSGNTPTAATLESALVNIGREDIIRQCIYTEDQPADPSSRLQGGYPGSTVTTFRTTEFIQTPHDYSTKKKDSVSDSRLTDHTDHGVTKYEIEEKNIIEEPSKPVAEHKREIEKRLSQERSSSLEKPEKKADELKMRTKIIEHVSLSETVSKDEPAPSFHEKRLSFERGSSQDRAKTDAFIQEEKKASGPSATVPEQVEAKVDEAAKLSFKEKRKSFEQGSLDKADKDDKKPKSDSNDKKPKSDSKKPDEKIPEAKDDPTTKAKPEKVTERKVVSETISKTVETIGDKKSIVSEKVTKTTEIKGDQKPVTTEVVTTTIHTAGDKKPVVSKTTTKIIEETDTVIIPGAKDTVDKSVSKPVVSETVTTVTKDSEIKTSVEPSKVKDIVKDTITKTKTESKPVDDIKVSVETAKEKPIVCETTTNVIKDIKSTDIKTLEISKDEPIISETITTIITDKKPSDQIRKTIEITESKPVFTETITTILTDQKPTDRTKTTETITKTVEPHVSEFKGTAEKVLSKTVVSDAVTTLTTDAKPTELSKTVVTTTTPLVSDIITTVQTESKAAVNEVITKESVPKDIQKTETKNIAPAVKAQEVIEVNKTAVKNDKPETFKDKLPSDVLDDICISESRVVSELITTKSTDGAPSVTKTTTEITTMSSESGKPDQTTTITEISVGKPDMTLEERRKSELFEGVTQGLLANVKNQDPKSKDIISPKLISTPPPSPADFKDATSASSPTTEQSWTSSDTKTTSSDKTAIFIEAERGTKPTDKPVQDSHGESETSSPKLKDQSEPRDKNDDKIEEEEEVTEEGNTEEPSGHKKSKKKRKRGKGKNNQNSNNSNEISEKETEVIKTEVCSEFDISMDEEPVFFTENINIIENFVEKKDKKKNKKGKKDNKGITQELLNATNIATSMILQDPHKPKETNTIETNNTDIVDTNEIQNAVTLERELNNFTPIITEVIPKKLHVPKTHSIPSTSSENHLLLDLEIDSDYLVRSGTDVFSVKPVGLKDDKKNVGETEVIKPDKIYVPISHDSTKGNASNVEPSKEYCNNLLQGSQNLQPMIVNEKKNNDGKNKTESNSGIESNDKFYSLHDDSDRSQRKTVISYDSFSTEVPDEIPDGTIKVQSKLVDKIPETVLSEKVTSITPDIVHESSKVSGQKIGCEIPNETSRTSRVITKTITTELPDHVEGVSKIVTAKLSTDFANSKKPESMINRNYFKSAAEEEELTDLEETKEIANEKFNDIIKNLSSSSREDIEQLLAGTLSQDPGTQDEKLTNLLIDMLIEQETMKLAASGDLPEALDSDGSDLEETNSTNQTSTISDNSVIDLSNSKPTIVDSVGNNWKRTDDRNLQSQRTMVKENSEPTFVTCIDMNDIASGTDGNSSPKPYVTTPTLSRRGIGGSQRYSREERPVLIEINKRYEGSSGEEDDNDETEINRYVVTEPSPTVIKRKVTFKFDSQDVISGDEDDENERVHFELINEPKVKKKKGLPINISRSSSIDSNSSKRNSIEIPKFDDLRTAKKVERKFERMASETLEDNSLAKGAVEGEFQRLTAQLSHEEMDECLMIWNESDLDPVGETKSEETQFDDEEEEYLEFESHEEPCSSQASRKKKEETSAEADSKKKADDATQK